MFRKLITDTNARLIEIPVEREIKSAVPMCFPCNKKKCCKKFEKKGKRRCKSCPR